MKEFLTKQVTNKMIWGTLIASVAIIILTTIATVLIANYKINSAQVGAVPSQNVSSNTKNDEENVVDMNTLTDVSKISEEELQKLNEKELEEAKKKEEENKNTTTTKQNKYYIKVNYGAQVVNVYTYDKNGKYTVPVKAFVCSTGTETPRSGVYRIPAKITWCHMFGDVYAHYCTQIVGNILFHSVPYLEKNNHTLEYWAYDKLGTKASMGCVRLTTRDAKWIFDNVSVGTQVEFYSSSNPGPLGKPTAQKISNAPGNLKWWDPTDPDPNNPWRNYKPDENNTQKNEQNTAANNTTTENQTTENSQTGNNQNSQTENTGSQNNQTGSNTAQNNQVGNNTNQNAEDINNQTQNGQNNNTQANNEQNNTNNQEQNGQENNQMTDTQI